MAKKYLQPGQLIWIRGAIRVGLTSTTADLHMDWSSVIHEMRPPKNDDHVISEPFGASIQPFGEAMVDGFGVTVHIEVFSGKLCYDDGEGEWMGE